MVKTLILAPHVDDETLGCFSFLDSDAMVLWFGVEPFHEVSSEDRKREAHTVAETAGFDYKLLDGTVNQYVTAHLISPIEKMIQRCQPHTILLPRPSYNQDHRAVYEAGFTAVRPHDRLPSVARVLIYDQVHASLWPRDGFEANYFRPIDLEAKMSLWGLHQSQHRGHRSRELMQSLATFRGQQAGIVWAEAFSVLRWVEQ